MPPENSTDQPGVRHHRPVLIDDEAAPGGMLAAPGARLKRRRGRPLGSKTRTEHGHVTADEFAFLRALAQGVDLTVAARQYLLWPGRMPERAALEQFNRQLLQRVAAGAVTLGDSDTARAMVQDLLALLSVGKSRLPSAQEIAEAAPPLLSSPDVPASQPASAPEATVPTLEEFASQFDEDMYGEAELIEMYEAEYPGGTATAGAPLAPELQLPLEPARGEGVPVAAATRQAPTLATGSAAGRIEVLLGAIDWLGARLSVVPELGHPIVQWIRLNPDQQQALASAGLITLGNLVDWIALRGERWFKGVPRYGVARARALEAWLLKWRLQPAQGLPKIGLQLAKAAALTVAKPAEGLVPVQRGPAPVTQATWPSHLRGEQGVYRSYSPNTLQAHDDLDAVQAWFKLIERRSPATQASYRRAIERLVMWAVHEKNTALSSLSSMDLLEFRDFLVKPPEHWMNSNTGKRRNDGGAWRPLRGPLKQGSLNLTFAAISSMYSAWRTSNYLSANPAEGIPTGPGREEATLDTSRSLSEQDMELVATTFQQLPDGPGKRRLAAVLQLLETSGLRRAELEGARWGALSRARVDGRESDHWVLAVVGKGNKKREVPIHVDAMRALEAHRQDRRALLASGVLKRYGNVPDSELPLIGVLDERRSIKRGEAPGAAAGGGAGRQDVPPGGAVAEAGVCGELSAPAIYAELKRFFALCGQTSRDTDQQARFSKASTHWMRHTFAHLLLRVTGKNLAIVQKVLGHSSMATTAIYVQADQKDTIAAVGAIRSTLGSV
ncbi:site-specific integrase [Acidovorax sp. LjRoot66]|uniref:tyrosine-type recombinase/integrase n=1 Tax=Acidovorax sp. LjRoot66 TaxID=3342334 RepID=UPI003ECE520A